jgi:hypothetical protein
VTIPAVTLASGRNDFHATIVGPAGETDPSPIVTYVLDQAAPTVTLSAPENGRVVNGAIVKVTGKTQGRSSIVARNETNGATATGAADAEGLFELSIPVGPGTNGITVTATDPAGNAGSATVAVRHGSGKLRASLTGSAYRFRISRLPDRVEFRVIVTDPDGRPLGGAVALFTVTVPGLEPIVSAEIPTSGDGSAVFRTRIAAGATRGDGLATVLVMAGEFGSVTDRQVLTIVR